MHLGVARLSLVAFIALATVGLAQLINETQKNDICNDKWMVELSFKLTNPKGSSIRTKIFAHEWVGMKL